MSEIPFVNQLGDALETAIVAPRPARRRLFGRRRRIGVLALAVLLAGATGVTVARITADPDQVAAGAVACYERADLSGDVAVLGTVTGSPTAACATTWSESRPPLVACLNGLSVAVIPGRNRGDCRAAGLAVLPPGYGSSRRKVARLERDVRALEATADCIPPGELTRRAQALLDSSGWQGWRAVGRPGDGGPCGRILSRGGSGEPALGGNLRADIRRLEVASGPPRSLEAQLFGETSLGVRLMDMSGERCYTVAGLEALARRLLAETGRPVTFKLGRLPANTGIEPPRGLRYDEGCAIVVGTAPVYPAPGEVAVEVEIWRESSS